MPFAPLPAPIAAAVLVLEYGVHRADLERALLDAPAARLDPFVALGVALIKKGSPPLPKQAIEEAKLTTEALRSNGSR